MSKRVGSVTRRRFIKTAASASAVFAVPQIIPATALGKDGAVPPSERIVVGGIGIGRRGQYDLGCFLPEPDVQFVAVCDVKANRREAVKNIVDQKHTETKTAIRIATCGICSLGRISTPF